MRLINQDIGMDFFLLEMILDVERVIGSPENPDSAETEENRIPIAAVRDKKGAAFATAQYLLEVYPEIDFKLVALNDADNVLYPIPEGHDMKSIVKIVEDAITNTTTVATFHGHSLALHLDSLDLALEAQGDPPHSWSTVYYTVSIQLTRLPMY